MGKWFAAVYDTAMKGLEEKKFISIRERLLEKATGRVLEIGSGTGINFPLYKNAEKVDAIEPDPHMIGRSELRLADAEVPIDIHQQSAEKLAFPDHTFDSVVATLVFCTIPDSTKALKEIIRVSKPEGRIMFFEHVKMPQPPLAKMQEILNPAWRKICGGCNLNRETLVDIQNAGIRIDKVDSYYNGLFVTAECTNTKE
ncbi:class I SAM-dependent methyltransferase [Neobacillus notoginsengisoli]|uniref:Class I SAM-dependent methyltransferase n=1 Tax=Neobacillus notoginsengisoli TaxID=1578198 RepID=A0A417YES1_9BACI|nr:class I SAM-dependent methyltransferase [Neobacillus notoginsengisoli]RHW31187.1 class I SAM-dependent methyltransferase [Neobacillus notoginsengisoli]